jgi:hypothetical protein
MDLIFEKAFHGETEPYAPHQFLCAMWSHASHLAGYEQQDAHEFLISLLDGLHLRCGGTSSDCRCVVHQASFQLWTLFAVFPDCWCRQTFGGLFRSVVTCLTCFSTYTAYDPLLEVAVDLTALHPTSLQPQTLIDCFDRYCDVISPLYRCLGKWSGLRSRSASPINSFVVAVNRISSVRSIFRFIRSRLCSPFILRSPQYCSCFWRLIFFTALQAHWPTAIPIDEAIRLHFFSC